MSPSLRSSDIGISQATELDLIFEALGKENDLIVTDSSGIILRASSDYNMHYGLGDRVIVGLSVYDLEREGIFSPSITVKVIKEKKKITLTQVNKFGECILATGIPIFDSANKLKYVAGCTSLNIAGELSPSAKFNQLHNILDDYYATLSKKTMDSLDQDKIIFNSLEMRHIRNTISQIADTHASILLTGETGVGKSLIARIIHECSSRKGGPFVEINCGAIPESLIESELFGYVSGAFTGANSKGKMGRIQMANGGTLFLDEIGEMSLNMQTRFLQLLQEKMLTQVGDTYAQKVDFRLVAATNRDLLQDVMEGRFRKDLFYRIHVVPIHIPALRERRDDIVPLAANFLQQFNQEYKKNVVLCKDVFYWLEQRAWPGNVRQLENEIERFVILSKSGEVSLEQLPRTFMDDESSFNVSGAGLCEGTYQQMMDDAERQIFLQAYKKYKTSVAVAAALDIGQTTAARKLRKYVFRGEGALPDETK